MRVKLQREITKGEEIHSIPAGQVAYLASNSTYYLIGTNIGTGQTEATQLSNGVQTKLSGNTRMTVIPGAFVERQDV